MANVCPICAEAYTIKSPGLVQECCNSVLCKNCQYSHIKSILEEGITGEGRKRLTCPFGCGKVMSDLTVRNSFRSQHPHLVRFFIGRPLYALFTYLGGIPIVGIMNNMFLFRLAVIFWKFSQSSVERSDLQLYEKWSLSTDRKSVV